MFSRILFFVSLFYLCFEHFHAKLEKNGPNVCEKLLEIKPNTSEYIEQSVKCYNGKPEYLISCLKDLHANNVVAYECCDGYFEQNNNCEPICSRCVHGECVGPDQCDCLPNFGGESCEQDCEFQKFGRHCEKHCGCVNDPFCSGKWTYCSCIGEIKHACRDICKCKLRLCRPGLMGEKCQMPCPHFKYGRGCLGTCSCIRKNTLECDKENGVCKCKKNFYGNRCESGLEINKLRKLDERNLA